MSSKGTHPDLERDVNAGRHAAGWVQSRGTQPKGVDDLKGSPHHRSLYPHLGHGQPTGQLRWVWRVFFPQLLPAARNVGFRVDVLAREGTRLLQHAESVHRPSAGPRHG